MFEGLSRTVHMPPSRQGWLSIIEYAEVQLLYGWLIEQRKIDFTVGQQTNVGRSVVLCPEKHTSASSAFRLGQIPVGELASPHHTRASMAQSMAIGDSTLTVVFHDSLSPDSMLVQSFRDTLELMNALFESRPLGPVVVLLFDSTADLAAAFPFVWASGETGDFSYSFIAGAHLAFIARQNKRFPIHELVHVAMGRDEMTRLSAGVTIPYTWKEGIARAIGGSRGVDFSQLTKSFSSTPEFVALVHSHRTHTLRQIRLGADSLWIRDTFGAAARLIIREHGVLGSSFVDVDSLTLREWLGNVQARLRVSEVILTRNLITELESSTVRSLWTKKF